MSRVLAFFLVVLCCAVCSYGNQIVLQSIDAEDGFIRSDESTGETDRIRIGAGESPGRTFISIISFDTTALEGVTINAAKIAITVMNNHIWNNPNPDPDQFGPTIDVCTAFSGNIAFQIPSDRSAAADAYNVDGEPGAWGLTGAQINETIYIDLSPTAIAHINTSGRTQFRINSGTASGSHDDAIDFYDGGNFLYSPLLIINPTSEDPCDPLDLIFDPNSMMPTGEYYEANVPDTLDLAERAKIGVEGLSNIINWPDNNYAPYGHAMFNYNPPFATDEWGPGRNNWGKTLEPLVLMRGMCGSPNNLDVEANSFKGMIKYIMADRDKAQSARAEMALTSLYESNHELLLRDTIENLKQILYDITYENDYAYYSNDPPILDNSVIGIQNYVSQTHDHGPEMSFLCRWFHATGDENDLDLAGKISRFVRKPEFWEPEAEPVFFVGAERAHFKGHIHSYAQGLMGLLRYADAGNEAWLKEFVRNGYEWIRNTGIARLGLFGETCITGDMTILAVELSEDGIGDYWEDVDQYVRNHLTEMQVLDANAMQAVIDQMPDPNSSGASVDATDEILSRYIGTFFTDGGHPTVIPYYNLRNTICCTGNGAKGLCYAWKSIVQYNRDGVAKVNLLLNRASPWLDIDSYLPYEGKVVIRNKTANKISVRIPRWVDKSAVTCNVNNEPITVVWIGNYLDLNRLRSGDVITIEFPMVETTETYTLKWKHSDWAWECNWEPSWWTPLTDPCQFTCHFRGNTLVDISPRIGGLGYQLYQRDNLIGATHAPMKTVTRFVESYDFGPDACTDRPVGDFDGDCRVTLADFAKITSEWLDCGLADQGKCWE
jgi:hypothetical protein